MNAPTIQPGTRCECRDWDCTEHHKEHHPEDVEARAVPEQCTNGAVRMMTVPTWEPRDYRERPNPIRGSHVPMCAPCAEYHEQKAGAR